MPSIGGRCRKLWKLTARAMVRPNKPTTTQPPYLTSTSSLMGSGLSTGTAKLIMPAVTTQLVMEGSTSTKNSWNCTWPACQIISVVMSPKGLNTPPALAATTTLMQPRTTKRVLSPPIETTTAAISRAVVRLSAKGDMAKEIRPVIQNSLRREKPALTSFARSRLKMPRSSMVLM